MLNLSQAAGLLFTKHSQKLWACVRGKGPTSVHVIRSSSDTGMTTYHKAIVRWHKAYDTLLEDTPGGRA